MRLQICGFNRKKGVFLRFLGFFEGKNGVFERFWVGKVGFLYTKWGFAKYYFSVLFSSFLSKYLKNTPKLKKSTFTNPKSAQNPKNALIKPKNH
jgi:hypothetical protein